MDIEKEAIKYKISKKYHTATVMGSTEEVSSTIIIPKFVEYKNERYSVTSINGYAFYSNYKIKNVLFAEDSEVESFGYNSFSIRHLQKLQIPVNLKKLNVISEESMGIREIEISPKNKNFSIIENTFLVGKSSESSDIFDTIYYTIKSNSKIVIPSQIKYINYASIFSSGVKSIIFPINSQLKSISSRAFDSSSIRKLILPGSVENIDQRIFENLKNLDEFQIIGKNKYYTIIDNKFLLKRKDLKSEFDELVCVFADQEEINIPAQVKTIENYSLNKLFKMKSLICPPISQLKLIKQFAITQNQIERLILPGSIEKIEYNNFTYLKKLKDIQFTGKNKFYSVVDNKIVLKRNDLDSPFDEIVYALIDIENVTIPPYVKSIKEHAFADCKQLETVIFPENSIIKTIGSETFMHCPVEKFVFPESVTKIKSNALACNDFLISVQFNSSKIDIEMDCIYECNCLEIISFPNATEINFDKYNCTEIPKETEIHVRSDVCFSGYDYAIQMYKEHVKYVFNPPEEKNRIKREKPAKSFKPKVIESNPTITKQQNKSGSSIKNEQPANREEKLIAYIRSIEKRLGKYEKVIPFDPKNLDLNDFTFNENVNKSYQYDRFFIDEDDEKQQEVVSKIGEGNSCIAYKVIDHRIKQVLCKKIIKNNGFDGFNELKKKIKELEILQKNSHQCICEMIGANLQEKCNEKDGDDEYTTAAFFFEYLPYSLKELIENNSLNNTLKTKIALEVAFGMSFIHKQKQIHRNLNVDNIRLNSVFESKIINFAQVHVSDFFESNKTLTKLIGEFAYMSPEMAREEDYDEKTDVYSYGVILYFIFNERLPKQSMNDKINKKKITFPKPSKAISQPCIDLIKKCMSYESKDRPSFDDIIHEIYLASFELASEVDISSVLRRYQSLNFLNMQ